MAVFASYLRRWVPFGLLSRTKPRHYRTMLQVLWDNRGRWAYALRILRHGVCDGCSLGPRGLRDDVIPGVHLCLTRLTLLRLNTMGPLPKGMHADVSELRKLSNEQLHRLGRVPYPLLRRKGEAGFSRVSWDEALSLVASRWQAADPDRVGVFVTSRGLTNETYYTVQKLARIAGTPHVDTCARLCHAASSVGLKDTIGFAAPTLSLKDWIGAELIVVIGSNLPNNQPVSTKYLHAARKAGAKIVVVNPFKEPSMERYWIPSLLGSSLFGSRLMDEFFGVRPGGDIAFCMGVLKALDEDGGWDEAFIAARTHGADDLRAACKAQSWASLADDAGLPESEMRRFATMYKSAKKVVFVYSMGLTQYQFGVDNVKMVVNLALARGMIGKPNTGIMPIRGHSGVQGSAECGADPDKLPGALPLNKANIERFETAWNHPIPHKPGMRAAHLLDRAGATGLDVLYMVGGNHLETMPDRDHAQRALQAVRLRVHQDIVLNTSTLLDAEEAVLVLPAQTRYEQASGGTSTSTERRIRFTPEIPGPRIEEAKPEWQIPCLIGLALRPGRHDLFGYADTAAIRDEMGALIPMYAGIETLKREGDWVQWGGPQLGGTSFGTEDGKAIFSCVPVPRVEVPEGAFLLSMRRGKQFNSMTFGPKDPLSQDRGRNAIFCEASDLAALGLREGASVRVRSPHGELEGVCYAGPCRKGHVQAYWPEGNVLLSRVYDPVSGEPDYKTVVTLTAV
ncbi:MAG: molybdopterin-dependent oxidoreductase [Deltaproteobacteria bacterium]|nr:molybdopterin-dependent oxidoreductase [Deltaproteobacteria bacterium]